MAEKKRDQEHDENNKSNPKFFGSATVGSRGQIVIPSDLREKLDIRSDDKLLFVILPHHSHETEFAIMKPEAIFDIAGDAKRFQKEIAINDK